MVPPLLTGRPQPSFLFGEGEGDSAVLERAQSPATQNRAISFYFELFKLYFFFKKNTNSLVLAIFF